MREYPTLDRFTPLVGRIFKLPEAPGVEIALSEAKLLPPWSRPPRDIANGRDPFDLIFIGPLSPILPQGIYRMEVEGSAPLEIFIVPIGPEGGGMGYQAVFN
jgi:hypothetical protein